MTDLPVLLMRVASTVALPGLGLLALPGGPDGALQTHPLHAALAIEARLPNGHTAEGTATVEEIDRAGQTTYGLLLEFNALVAVPTGTEIWGCPSAALWLK